MRRNRNECFNNRQRICGFSNRRRLADLGNQVTLVDIDNEKVKKINSGASPIFEPGLPELIQKNKKRLKATTDFYSAVQNSDITFICVGTPSNEDGSIDLTFVESAD